MRRKNQEEVAESALVLSVTSCNDLSLCVAFHLWCVWKAGEVRSGGYRKRAR